MRRLETIPTANARTTMQYGVALSMEWLADLSAVKTAVVTADEEGFDFVTTSGHLLTASSGRYPQLPPFTYGLPYRDHFVLYSHLAALTSRISFRTAILILPTLPTAVVAKQAADLSLLSGGRVQLGVGVSWQEAEYRALGQDFHQRGRRLEEQIEVLGLLWSEPLVTFKGRFHDLDDVGLGQLPDSPIPIWIGCGAEPHLLKRVVDLAVGWIPGGVLDFSEPVQHLRELAQAAQRTEVVRVSGRVVVTDDADQVIADARRQVEAGATELTLALPPDVGARAGVAVLIQARRWLTEAGVGA